MDNRFYIQALGVTGLFVTILILVWIASGGPASEAAIQNSNHTRTAMANTASYLLQPRTSTPQPFNTASSSQTSLPTVTSTNVVIPSVTNTSLSAQFTTPIASIEPSPTSLLTQTVIPSLPVSTVTVPPDHFNTKAPPLAPASGTETGVQSPDGFMRWYFTRVWTERDYQNLWDNYLTASFKSHVGSGLFDDYVWWWNTVQRVEINSVDVLQNNGSTAQVLVNLTFHMQDGRVVDHQVYQYYLVYDPSRATWMFDFPP